VSQIQTCLGQLGVQICDTNILIHGDALKEETLVERAVGGIVCRISSLVFSRLLRY
jgi:hypothetical protein